MQRGFGDLLNARHRDAILLFEGKHAGTHSSYALS